MTMVEFDVLVCSVERIAEGSSRPNWQRAQVPTKYLTVEGLEAALLANDGS